MAAVKIDSGPIDPRYKLDDVPEDQWRVLMQVRRDYLGLTLPYDCRCLLEFVDDAERMSRALGFEDEEDFIKRGLELDPKQVQWAIDGLRRMKPNEPIGYERAQTLGKREGGAPVGNKNAAQNNPDNIKVVSRPRLGGYGTSRAYILARLDRDGETDLAADVRSGVISASAAARRMGWQRDPSPRDRILKLLPKLSIDECESVRSECDRLLSISKRS